MKCRTCEKELLGYEKERGDLCVDCCYRERDALRARLDAAEGQVAALREVAEDAARTLLYPDIGMDVRSDMSREITSVLADAEAAARERDRRRDEETVRRTMDAIAHEEGWDPIDDGTYEKGRTGWRVLRAVLGDKEPQR